jgi:tRNA 2-selenouridine synthase
LFGQPSGRLKRDGSQKVATFVSMIDIKDFLSLRSSLPVVDVRSENEYTAGHIRSSVNIPLLNNAERIAVGTDYKQKGQQEAIKTGFRLVGPRLADMMDEAHKIGDELLVYCWRGGMRSANFCQFANMSRIKTHSLKGGYKSYRQLALDVFNRPYQFVVIGGYTGSGKSEILRALSNIGEQVIDLEKLASHKGSAFGGLMMPPQPTTEQFQNDLFEETVKLDPTKRIWIEDESLAVGKIFLPRELWKQLSAGPVVELAVSKEERIERLVNEYGSAQQIEFLEAMAKIKKKLGGQNYNEAKEKYLVGDLRASIDLLLAYYDKAYTFALEKKKDRIKLHTSWNGKDVSKFAAQLVSEIKTAAVLV